MAPEASLSVGYRRIEAVLLRGDGEHDEAITETGVDRSNRRVALFGAQLEEVGLAPSAT